MKQISGQGIIAFIKSAFQPSDKNSEAPPEVLPEILPEIPPEVLPEVLPEVPSETPSEVSPEVLLEEDSSEYALKLQNEQSFYKDCTNVHDLPDIFHYWSNKYLAPDMERFGFTNPDDFFAHFIKAVDPVINRPWAGTPYGIEIGERPVKIISRY